MRCPPTCCRAAPDVLAARARISAAMRGRDAAHADFYPNINLVAAIGFQALGLASLFSADALTMGVGPAVHLPIFDAGRLRAQYARATADLDAAVADYNGAVVTAVRQTADALTEVASLSDQRLEQQKALDSAGRALKLAEETLPVGPVGPDSHADRRKHVVDRAPADGGAGGRGHRPTRDLAALAGRRI